MSLVNHYRTRLKQEQDHAIKAQKDIADLSAQISRTRQSLSRSRSESQQRTYERQLDSLINRQVQAEKKLADSQKKVAGYAEQLHRAEQKELAGEAKRQQKLAREQQQTQADLERRVARTSTAVLDLSERVSSIEESLLSRVHDAVVADPVPREFDVFLSHAGPDKELASDLFVELTARGLEVWFDGATLELGGPLTRQIDRGIAKARVGIVLITKEFLKGRYWTEREVGGFFAARRRLIPILDGVDHDDLAVYSPLLADLVGLTTRDTGLDEIAQRIVEALEEPTEGDALSDGWL